jgi:hypothetical protein
MSGFSLAQRLIKFGNAFSFKITCGPQVVRGPQYEKL